jgi:hypothetical protein
LNCADASEGEEELEDRRSNVGSVGPEAVVSCRSGERAWKREKKQEEK